MRSLSVRRLFLSTAALLAFASLSANEVAAQTLGPGDVLFSEFRLSGPAGASDEYMELYCNRDSDCDVSGYFIQGFDPSFGDFTVELPAATVIPAREHLLVADLSQYSLGDYATPDLDTSSPGLDIFLDNEGFQLRTPDQATVLDSVGFAGAGGRPGENTNYVEGTGLQRATSRPADQYAYVRKMGTATAGRPQDTNNNAADFALVSVTGAAHAGITNPPVLGAPGPQSVSSARTYGNSVLTGSLVEPAASASASPNRVITLGGDNRYKLSIRRTITNNHPTDTVNYLSFRVIDITTTGSPQIFPQQAQLRLITSGDAETFTNSQNRVVTIRGTVLEFDPNVNPGLEPSQPNGGGLNTSANVPLSPGLAPGESVDVQLLLDVVQGGSYRFYVNVEAVLADTPPPPVVAPAASSPVTSTTTSTAARTTGTRATTRSLSPVRKATVVKQRTTVITTKKAAAPTTTTKGATAGRAAAPAAATKKR